MMIDKIKLVISLLLVGAGVAGFYLLEDHAMVVRILAVLAGLISAAAALIRSMALSDATCSRSWVKSASSIEQSFALEDDVRRGGIF